MHYLFESGDVLNSPIECFLYNPAQAPFPVKPHWHYFMEIIYITEGSAEIHSDGSRHLLYEGDMIILHPKAVHGIYAADGNPLRYAVLKFDINKLTITSSYAPKLRSIFRCAEKRGADIVLPSGFTAAVNAEKLFSDCISEVGSNRYGFDIIIKTRVYELLIQVIRYWQERGFSIDSEAFAEDDRYDIYNITEYIDAHLSEGIRVEDIAKHCGMSYSYFAKRFLSVYGKSCKEYIETMRLYKVEEFLLFTDFDLNYISQETGFSDCSHMIKSFRRSRGVTPKRFRTEKARTSAEKSTI
ncbi:MAG: AraC family transcriptional regulator [Oscillospiraceae bacterium]|nr:AraC family transcriptional regulator [Oscillospiraceae bacterium]